MKMLYKLFTMVFITVVTISCQGNSAQNSASNSNSTTATKAKYVFYFIGDGMAAPQVRLAEAALTVPQFQENYAKLTNSTSKVEGLNIKTLSVTGLATTNAENRYITDSAAAGTALATGSKTDVGVISEKPDGTKLKTIAEAAKEKGMKVGIVSSVSIDHATPACFYSHAPSRSKYADISEQILTSGFDYFAGGCPKWEKRAAKEGTDLPTAFSSFKAKAETAGFKMVTTKAEFDNAKASDNTPVIATIDMLSNKQYIGDGSALPYTIDLAHQASDDDRISLAQFTAKGIELLDNEKGFFMMVEGGKIDWACHANDAATCTYEVVAFDEAIGVALQFAAAHPNETLIIVTGDHDCGGLAIGYGGTGYESAFELLARPKMSATVFGSHAIAKITAGESFNKLLAFACEQYGFTNNITDGSEGLKSQTAELSDFEVKILREAYGKSVNKIQKRGFDDTDKYYSNYGGYDPFTTTCSQILNNKAGVDFTSFTHTAVPVMVFAHGTSAQLFSGYYDNTDIAKKIKCCL